MQFSKDGPMGGSGGGILQWTKMEIAMTFNTGLMHRAWATSEGNAGVGVLKGEEKQFPLNNKKDQSRIIVLTGIIVLIS